jgi:hypothetical protein
MAEPPKSELNAGLCSSCLNARRIASDRGSVFIMCKVSAIDPAFPKYPRLPVLSCSAYSPGSESTRDASS